MAAAASSASSSTIKCLAHDSTCSAVCTGRNWTPRVLADKKSLEYFNELKRFDVTIYGYECHNEVRAALRAWVTHTAAKFFFDEMDYFDTTDTTINAKYEKIFRPRINFSFLVLLSNINNEPFFNQSVGEPWFDPPAILRLWKKMGLVVDKTPVWWYKPPSENPTHSPWRRHNLPDFNIAYLKNLTELGRKQLETFVENTRIELQLAMTRLDTAHLCMILQQRHESLQASLAEHKAEYSKMAYAHEQSQKAITALQAKVVAQDALNADLSAKMAKLIDLFGWFKEEAPRTMLHGLADKIVLRLEEAPSLPKTAVGAPIPLVQKIPVPLALKGAVTDAE